MVIPAHYLYVNSLKAVKLQLSPLFIGEQVTPAQIREAEKSLKIMESMINVMTPGNFVSRSWKFFVLHMSSFSVCVH